MGRFDDQSDARSFAYLLINDGFKHIRLNDFTNDDYTGSLILGMPSEKELEKALENENAVCVFEKLKSSDHFEEFKVLDDWDWNPPNVSENHQNTAAPKQKQEETAPAQNGEPEPTVIGTIYNHSKPLILLYRLLLRSRGYFICKESFNMLAKTHSDNRC